MKSFEVIRSMDNVYRAFIAPVAAAIGIIGNIVIIIIFIRMKIRRFEFYCLVLAIVNLFAVIFNTLLDDFLGRGMAYLTTNRWSFTPNLWSNNWCRLLEFCPTMMYFCSAYILIIFTLDRALVMSYPFRFVPNSHLAQAAYISGFFLFFSLIASLPLTLSHHLVSYNNTRDYKCELTDSMLSVVSLYIKSLGIFVLPTVIIIVLNIIIVYRISEMQQYQRVTTMLPVSGHEMNRIVGHMALSISFLILTIPLSIIIILRLIVNNGVINNDPDSVLTQLSKLFSSVKDISYCCNIFLYLIFLPNFRKHSMDFIRCKYRQAFLPFKNSDSVTQEKLSRERKRTENHLLHTI